MLGEKRTARNLNECSSKTKNAICAIKMLKFNLVILLFSLHFRFHYESGVLWIQCSPEMLVQTSEMLSTVRGSKMDPDLESLTIEHCPIFTVSLKITILNKEYRAEKIDNSVLPLRRDGIAFIHWMESI